MTSNVFRHRFDGLAATRTFLLSLAVLLSAGVSASAADKPPGNAVASAHPLATKAGLDILAAGGNAFDAAVAITAAIAVVEPTGSGIGGGGFWLLHRASDRFETMVDGREVAPFAATPTMYQDASGKAIDKASRDGPLSAGIPGEPAALVYLAKKYGKLPLEKSLAPAIELAKDGFAVDAKLVKAIEQNQARFSPAARAVFLPGGKVPTVGQKLRQTDLAAVIKRLADKGLPGFYDGETAKQLLAGVSEAGGIWSADDLHRYTVVERSPMVTWFRDYRLVSAPPPSAGGLALIETLQQLEAIGWSDVGDGVGKHLVVEALRRAYRDRAAWLGDPDFVRIPLARLASRSYALELAKGIVRDKATPSASLPPAPLGAPGGTNTSHFSVIDAEGNRVAATMSINLSFGSAYMAPGTGILLNDEMDDFAASTTASNAYGLIGSEANLVAPRKRPLSTMSPTFIEGPNGVLVLGTPGGSRIATMVLLGVLNFVNGADVKTIVAAPRYHHQYLPDVVQYEPGAFSPEEVTRLTAMGHELKLLDSTYGNLQAVLWRPANDTLEAAADPRGVGSGEVRLLKRRD
ncbi:gamma-glutamyltransferase [uncultured Nevskia sp.]|uniref:gamma-glutamyltransferase n=1 Tax=uncultured Nevskia sp. TaxID=228950 RepID=UPI0025F6574B|nr:gamma-glutamyltransferase [uncultured Nevskia sp.]